MMIKIDSAKLLRIFKKTWEFLDKDERKKGICIALLMVVGTAFEVVSLGALLPLLNSFLTGTSGMIPVPHFAYKSQNQDLVIFVIIGFIILIFGLKEAVLLINLWLQSRFVSRLETRYQSELFNQYTKESYTFHISSNSSQLTRDILDASNFARDIVDPLLYLFSNGLTVLAFSVVLIALDPTVIGITISVVFFVTFIFSIFTRQRISAWGLDRQQFNAQRIKQINEAFLNIKEIIVSNRGDFFRSRFATNAEELSLISSKFVTINGMSILYLEFVAIVGMSSVVVAGVLMGRTPQSYVPTLGIFAVASFRLMPCLSRITNAIQSLRMGEPIIERLEKSSIKSTSRSTEIIVNSEIVFLNSIEFKNVCFTYPNSNKPALQDVNLQIKKGSLTGIVGKSGVGKSTTIDVLMGLLKPSSGLVTVDGQDIYQNIFSWRKKIGYVSQVVTMIDDSIMRNVTLGLSDSEIDRGRLYEAVKIAELEELIESLTHGIDTIIGERGVKLSGGQRQRIGIARALYSAPPIYVLDEATNALDELTEERVLTGIRSRHKDDTIFIVTHRQSALVNCTQIISIDDEQKITIANN